MADEKREPAVVIFWNEETQTAEVHPNPAVVKTWEFAKAVLQMASDHADRTARMAFAQRSQAQAEEQERTAKMIATLRNGH